MFECDNCGYQSPRSFGLCFRCKEGMGREVKETISAGDANTPNFGGEWRAPGIPQFSGTPDIREIDPNAKEAEVFKATKFKALNEVLSSAKGLVEAQVVLLGAAPGSGKSTLCAQIADSEALYISSEENYAQVNARALRVNPNGNFQILCSTSIDEILTAINQTDKKLIIIDSLNSIEFGVGYQTVAKFANNITQAVKYLKKTCIIISQVSRTGEITGMNSIPHIVDTVMYLERSETSSNLIATTSKNRYGEIGMIAVFQHQENGLVEIELDSQEKNLELGTTYTTTKFGHKQMPISIEALVVNSTGSFGLKKANGYNQNRFLQVLGILNCYAKIDFNSRDVYLQIGNGLFTDDISIELAIANSILSSYYNKAIILEAKGELKLNGRILNGKITYNNKGTIEETEIKNISELIELYKNIH